MRRALLAAFVAGLLFAAFDGCGGGGGTATTAADKESDIALMNQVLGRQIAAVRAYQEVLPRLEGATLAAAREFRGHEQEHVDATVKALKGLGGAAEPTAEEIDAGEVGSAEDALHFLYDLESATIHSEFDAIEELGEPWPRELLASMAAEQAQRLVLIRRALGAKPPDAIPSAFEDGTTPAP